MWDPPSCEGLLYSCCIDVVNLTFSHSDSPRIFTWPTVRHVNSDRTRGEMQVAKTIFFCSDTKLVSNDLIWPKRYLDHLLQFSFNLIFDTN
jgi:hypothetical protein